MAERPLARERQADQPVQQHGIGGADDVLQGAQLGDARRRHARSSAAGRGRRRWRRAAPGWRRRGWRTSARAGCAMPARRRRRRTRARRPAGSSAACSSVAHCTCDLARVEPARRGHHQQRSALIARRAAGTRPSAARAGCCGPERQLPMTGVRAGSRLYGSRAREPLTPAAAVVPPSVPASLSGHHVPSVSAKLPLPWGSITGSARQVGGNPVGVEALCGHRRRARRRRARRRASACRRWDPVPPSRRWPGRTSCR